MWIDLFFEICCVVLCSQVGAHRRGDSRCMESCRETSRKDNKGNDFHHTEREEETG